MSKRTKTIITATVCTLLFILEIFLSPFFSKWYLGLLEVEYMPFPFFFGCTLLGIAQLALIMFLWTKIASDLID